MQLPQVSCIFTEQRANRSITSHEDDLDDVGCNADLYAYKCTIKQDAFQGCSNHERSQQVTDPYCFQLKWPLSLSLD